MLILLRQWQINDCLNNINILFDMAKIETVKVLNKDHPEWGKHLVNYKDYDPSVHELIEAKENTNAKDQRNESDVRGSDEVKNSEDNAIESEQPSSEGEKNEGNKQLGREQHLSSEKTRDLINLNTATKTELIMLPTIGKMTAQKIIDRRPYSSFDDFESKVELADYELPFEGYEVIV